MSHLRTCGCETGLYTSTITYTVHLDMFTISDFA